MNPAARVLEKMPEEARRMGSLLTQAGYRFWVGGGRGARRPPGAASNLIGIFPPTLRWKLSSGFFPLPFV